MDFVLESWLVVPFVLAWLVVGFGFCRRYEREMEPNGFPYFFALALAVIFVAAGFAVIHADSFLRLCCITVVGGSAGFLGCLMQLESRKPSRCKPTNTAYELAKERSELLRRK